MGGQNPPKMDRGNTVQEEAQERPLPSVADLHYVWSRLQPEARKKYSYLEEIGHVPTLVVPVQRERDPRFRFEDQLFSILPDDLQERLKGFAGEYYCADADVSSYDASVRKMDFGPVRKYKHTEAWTQAKNYIYDEYGPLFSKETRITEAEELFPVYNLDSSAGVPMQQVGLKKKKDVLTSWYGREYMSIIGEDYVPLWRVSGKREWLHATDIDNKKVRTFIVPPFKLLHQQKRFFHSQNMAMKQFHWSAYGFNPYQGGVDAMARKLLVHKIYVMYDVKGWDRLIPNMRTCYKLRANFHKGRAAAAARLIGQMTCTTVMVLADGTIVVRRNGNCSGSGCTTNDNIICHSFILAYILFKMFDGQEALVRSVVAFLFGDDDALSLPDIGLTDEEIKIQFVEGFKDFGLELDPFLVTRNLEEIEFLGFTFLKKDGFYYPKYKVERLLAAFCYEYDSKIPSAAAISKAYALMVMTYPSGGEVYSLMRRAYKLYCRHLRDDDDLVVQSFISMGLPSDLMIDNFYTGKETSNVAELFSTEGLEVYNISSYVSGNIASHKRRTPHAKDGRQQDVNPSRESVFDCRP